MTIIGNLAVSITARTSKFTKDMSVASRAVSSFASGSVAAAAKVTALGAAITTALAGAGLVTLVKRQFDAIDSTTKMADRLGIATERLVGLQYAAERTGVSVQNMQLGLQRMTRRVAEAAQGTGEAQKALKVLGLNAKELSKLSPDEQFREIAEAMEKVNGSSARVSLAFKIFDSEGVGLINTMRGGRKALDDFQASAERLGLTFSREMGAKIEIANDRLGDVKALFTGIARTVAIELSPVVAALAEEFVAAGTSGEGMGEKVVDAMEAITEAIILAGDAANLLKSTFKGVQSVSAGFLSSVAGGQLTETGQALGQRSVESFRDAIDAMFDASSGSGSERVAQMFDRIREASDAAASAIAGAASAAGSIDISDAMEQIRAEEEAALAAERQRNEMVREAEQLARSVMTPMQQLQSQAERVAELFKGGFISESLRDEAFGAIEKQVKDLIEGEFGDGPGDIATPGAIERRFAAGAGIQRDFRGPDPIERNTGEMADRLAEAVRILDEIRRTAERDVNTEVEII